jgi:hypothetical protein
VGRDSRLLALSTAYYKLEDEVALIGTKRLIPSILETVIVKDTSFSLHPKGKCKVVNLYVDPVSGKLVIEYDNSPQG